MFVALSLGTTSPVLCRPVGLKLSILERRLLGLTMLERRKQQDILKGDERFYPSGKLGKLRK